MWYFPRSVWARLECLPTANNTVLDVFLAGGKVALKKKQCSKTRRGCDSILFSLYLILYLSRPITFITNAN